MDVFPKKKKLITKNGQFCIAIRGNSNRLLTINPTDKYSIAQIKYLKSGVIYHQNTKLNDENNAQYNSEIDNDLTLSNSLNLNNIHLSRNRKRIYEDFVKILEIQCRNLPNESPKAKAIIQKKVAEWQQKQLDNKDMKYKYRPYCGIILYHFRQYLIK